MAHIGASRQTFETLEEAETEGSSRKKLSPSQLSAGNGIEAKKWLGHPRPRLYSWPWSNL